MTKPQWAPNSARDWRETANDAIWLASQFTVIERDEIGDNNQGWAIYRLLTGAKLLRAARLFEAMADELEPNGPTS